MKLTGLQIGNFKAFGKLQKIPIRPITLIYGENSSGKSSILHALALANEAIRTRDLDIDETVVGGESIDLGGFRQYVHRRDTNRSVSLGFEYSKSGKKFLIESEIASRDRNFYEASFEPQTPHSSAHIKTFSISVNDEPPITMSSTHGDLLKIEPLEKNLKFIDDLLISGLEMFPSSKSDIRKAFESQKNEKAKEITNRILSEMHVYVPGMFPYMPPDQTSSINAQSELALKIRDNFPGEFTSFVNSISQDLIRTINRFRYLGPLRSYPPRNFASAKYHDENWYAGGGYAWDLVCRDKDVRKRINEWLGPSRLSTPYIVDIQNPLALDRVNDLIPEKIQDFMEENYVDIIETSDIEDTEGLVDILHHGIETNVKSLIEHITKSNSDRFSDPVLLDLRSYTEVSHRDVGIGISQVLPVLVYAYASQGALIAIEQPEIHLHPALQAELGDVFIESALDEGADNTLLLETHSEHLLLRIMRRMRETCDGTLPEGIPKVRPEDVMVLFVERHESDSVVREMPLNERGELEEEWPGGFFEEDLREVF